jgi:hypothetical protein
MRASAVDGAVQSPIASPSPRKRCCRAKAPRNHNPRVGGSSPSSGIRSRRPNARCRAKNARNRHWVAGPQRTPTNALWADIHVPPVCPPGRVSAGCGLGACVVAERRWAVGPAASLSPVDAFGCGVGHAKTARSGSGRRRCRRRGIAAGGRRTRQASSSCASSP